MTARQRVLLTSCIVVKHLSLSPADLLEKVILCNGTDGPVLVTLVDVVSPG